MEEIKSNLEKIGLKALDGSKYNLLTTLQWSDKYGEGGNVLVSRQLPGKDILNLLGYQKNDNIYIDFQDKEITDIGAGLGGLIFELENSAKKINAVDPLYSSENREEILDNEIIRGEKRVEDINQNIQIKINEINKEIDKLEFEKNRNPSNHQLIYDIEYLKDQKIELLKNKKTPSQKVLEDLKQWGEKGFKNSEKIKLIGESGENTQLPDSSQDYVFMNNVITKNCLNPYKVLSEASRILKPGGKIIIIDQQEEVKNIFEKFEKKFQKIGNSLWILELEKEEISV